MDINTIKEWANQNSGFATIIDAAIGIFLVFIGWTTGFLKWIFKGSRHNEDKRKAGILLEGKHARLSHIIAKGPDAGLIDKGEDSHITNGKFESLGDKK